MSRLINKCLPFFKVLKKKTCFGWDEEVKQAFQKLKKYFGRLHRMVSPVTREPLLAYLIVADHTVSTTLLVERDTQQVPIYYVSHVLAGSSSATPH